MGEKLNTLYTQPNLRLRARAPANLPEDMQKSFVVSAPERMPASLPAQSKAVQSQVRRSRLPASVANGFELRVQYNKLTSMFWVVEREQRYDLVFANSAGSKASLGLAPETFKALHRVAYGFTPLESNLKSCPEASMQLHVVARGSPERTVTMCVNSKGTAADQLRGLSQSLAAMIR